MESVNTPPNQEMFVKTRIYTLIGEPIALARPRFNVKDKKVYDSQFQAKIGAGLQLRTQHKGLPITTPMHINISFYLPCSKNYLHGQPYARRPDLDNLIKFILDVGNGIIWHDDALVVSLFAQKRYDVNTRTEFTIYPTQS